MISEFDDYLSQSAKYAEDGDSVAPSKLNLHGSDLDSLKDFVQNQKNDIEADQAKGRKSPANTRGTLGAGSSLRRGSFAGKMVHAAPVHSKDVDTSDHHSDTTEVEKYITAASDLGNHEISDMILRLASQMDHNEIDKAIAVLQHIKKIAAVSESPSHGSNTKRVMTISQTSQQAQPRSKSGPPSISSNRPPYRHSTSAGTTHVANFSSIDHGELVERRPEREEEEGEEEEVVRHNEYDDCSFIPPAIGGLNIHPQRSESEYSFASASNSRGSTPLHMKRSPTPVTLSVAPTADATDREHCPVLERAKKTKPWGFMDVNPINTVFFRPSLSRETSGVGSPRSQANDDVVSVGSSHSSFTAVTSNSTGGHSFSQVR